MNSVLKDTQDITDLILRAAEKARRESPPRNKPGAGARVKWPVECTVGPGLEGAIACETRIGYVDGTRGSLLYQGYDIFDLCAYSTFEEVSYLLLHGRLPTRDQLAGFNAQLGEARYIPNTMRMLMGFPVEELNPMAALRLGANLMRQRLTWRDNESAQPDPNDVIASDEDSIGMETPPRGEQHAIYEFRHRRRERPRDARTPTDDAAGIHSCVHLISGIATITAGIARLREKKLPIEADPGLGHAANFLYMMTGRKPTAEETRVLDVALILHADHGMNASTFASLVVASTLSDIYFSVGAGIAALNGPLHGGANEQAVKALREIGSPERVPEWFEKAQRQNKRVPGFGHRVYKTYDPRARILGPLAHKMSASRREMGPLFKTARALEKTVVASLGKEKGVFPNVDFYSGLVYSGLGIDTAMFPPIFAISRVSGWTARILEYLRNNRIFRPRAMYVGEFDKRFEPINARGK